MVKTAGAPGGTLCAGVGELRVKSVATGGVPVPVRMTVCGLPVALSATEIDALNVVAELGVKVTEMLQVAATARVDPQVFAEIAKSAELAPASEMLVRLSVALPGLESTVLREAEMLPTVVLGKERLVGVRTA